MEAWKPTEFPPPQYGSASQYDSPPRDGPTDSSGATPIGSPPADPVAEGGEWEPPNTALNYDPTSKDSISVRIVPEMEGMFMFRHVVYSIEGTLPQGPGGGNTASAVQVVRRYSDFTWLLDCLVKIYPFRLLPVLPPKRLAVDGRYLSSGNLFLERRRKGLARFVNQLVKHPVLRAEKLVQMFLLVDTELSSWRKESSFRIEEELSGRIISAAFAAKWNQQTETEKWNRIRAGVQVSLDVVGQLCFVVERMHKRQEAMAQDFKKLSSGLTALAESAGQVYSIEEASNEIGAIKDGVTSVARYSSNANSLVHDESQSTDADFLEDLKLFRALLGSIFELFNRYERFGGNNVIELEQRIRQTEVKIESLATKPDTKPADIDKLRAQITADRKSIEFQTNRDWLIKECMTEELILSQRTQFQIARALKSWAADNTKYSELLKDNWAEMQADAQHFPTP